MKRLFVEECGDSTVNLVSITGIRIRRYPRILRNKWVPRDSTQVTDRVPSENYLKEYYVSWTGVLRVLEERENQRVRNFDKCESPVSHPLVLDGSTLLG